MWICMVDENWMAMIRALFDFLICKGTIHFQAFEWAASDLVSHHLEKQAQSS